ncbi:hypothetical protein SY88_10110 [Clostridiales bacterium PH28_bin88]|nr:hypothetical protein SY88_10110 [Clostridiales bacterium PH28_bin88]
MSIRACSYVDKIVIDKPKELFRQFRRLGVYEWADVLGEANGDYNREIMAVCFSDTELFDVPIYWSVLKQILLEEEGRTAPIQSPVLISNKVFERIYRIAFNQTQGGTINAR